MPAELLSLRLLNCSISTGGLSAMKHSGRTIHAYPGTSVFSRFLPFKLKYLGFSRKLGVPLLRNEGFGVRRFSSGGSFRSRNGGGHRSNSVGRNSDFSRRNGIERGESQGGRGGGQAKSLIEDEDEISDWISGLKTDSFSVGLSGGESNGDSDREKDRSSRGRNSVSSTRKNQRNRGDEFSSSRRHRDSNSDDFSITNRRSSRSTTDSFSKNLRVPLSGSGPKRRYVSELEDDDNDALSPRRRDHGPGGGSSSTLKRQARDSELNFRKNAGTKSLKKKKDFLGSDMEDDVDKDDDSLRGFGNLLEETDSEEEQLVDSSLSGSGGKGVSSLHGSVKEDAVEMRPKTSAGATDSYLSQTRFDQCAISPLSLKGIKDAGYERMTLVQEVTLPIILKGKDVLAKAKTGTGKTVAFLLPAIEVVVKSPPVDRDQKRPPINVLVICPTRELASQAAAEANTLLKYHPAIGVQVVIGGVRLPLEQKRMQANPCQILVATPGRLRDHIENTAGFATRLMGVKVLVLDEADHLLDMGFRKEIERIIAAVPKQRQTLLFSATVPEEVRQICHIALKRDHEFISTVEEGSEETHSQVRQTHLVAPLDNHFPLLYVLLKEHISDDVDYKVLVFCTTAMVTRLVAGLLAELNLNVREIHSRKPQSYRTRVSDEFRKSKGLILVTSDVSARGVDYPDVTLVIQIGLPADREQYIHRLGRTGRKGKEGQGILLLAPWEEFFLPSLRDLPIAKASVPSFDPEIKKKVERALSQVEMKNKEAAYQAWLGYYNSNKTIGRDKYRLVELANEFSRSMGLDNPPAIPKLVLGKMGLRNVPGLRSK